jgi:hypothetical protein
MWKLLDISYFTDLRQTRDDKKIPKTVLEYSLRNISGAWRAGKNLKTDSDSTHQNKARIVEFFSTHICSLIHICWVMEPAKRYIIKTSDCMMIVLRTAKEHWHLHRPNHHTLITKLRRIQKMTSPNEN